MAACRRLLQTHPRHVLAMHNLAVACVEERRWRRARYWVRQALRIDPDNADLRRLLLKLRLHGAMERVSVLVEDLRAAAARWKPALDHLRRRRSA